MNLNDYLSSLGNTPEEVAQNLIKQGVKGKRLSHCHCPILNGIYQACPTYWSGLRIINGRQRSDGHWSYYASLNDDQILDPILPQPVMDFIGQFDTGAYPELACDTVKEVTTRVYS